MSESSNETQQLLGIYRAVDQAVVSGAVPVEAIGELLTPYQAGAAGWFAGVERMARASLGLQPDDPAPFPDLHEALRALGDIEPRSRMRARRLLALAVGIRAFPGVLGPEGTSSELVVSALVQPGLAEDEEGARRLLNLLANPELLPSLEHWEPFIHQAFGEGLVSNTMALTTQPCSSDMVLTTVAGSTVPVAEYHTHFCTNSVTVDQVKGFLDPANWPGCTDLWCEMIPMGTAADATQRYLEVIGPDCAGNGWKMRTCLEVGTADLPGGGAVMSYRKCPDLTASDGQVAVDEGSVTAMPNGTGGVCVETTKRLQFSQPFDGGGLALILCTFGWGTLAEDLVLGCAYNGAHPAKPWPGNTGPAGGAAPNPVPVPTTGTSTTNKPTTSSTSGTSGTSGTGGATAAVQPVIDDAVKAIKDCIDGCVTAYQNAYGKATDGTYSIDSAVNDAASSGQRIINDLATVFTLALRAGAALGLPTQAPPSTHHAVPHKRVTQAPRRKVP